MEEPIEVGQDALEMENIYVQEREARRPTEAAETTVPSETPKGNYSREEMIRIREGEELSLTMIADLNYSAIKTIMEKQPLDTSFHASVHRSIISPPPGVDPFALLKSCEGSKRKMGDDFADRFKHLSERFERCNKKELNKQTTGMILHSQPRWCTLCHAKIVSVDNMIHHICSNKHILQMKGVACADAFDFCWNAVDTVLIAEYKLDPYGTTNTKPPPVYEEVQTPCDGYSREEMIQIREAEKYKIMMISGLDSRAIKLIRQKQPLKTPFHASVHFPQIPAAPGVDPLALLKSCKDAKRKMEDNADDLLEQLFIRYEKCDKKLLHRKTKNMFPNNPPLECSLCESIIVSTNAFMQHISGQKHLKVADSVCADAFDFWWNAVNEETSGEPQPLLVTAMRCYSRHKMMRIRNSEKHNLSMISDLDYRAFENIKVVPKERFYSRDEMMRLKTLPGYSWQEDGVTSKDSLHVINEWLPNRWRKRHRVLAWEYWIWHNVNAQQSFAVYFGFFPFYLPYFDAEAFISAARPESIGAVYLISQLYQEHLKLRELKEGGEECVYRKEEEETKRRKLVEVYQKIARFPLTDKNSVVRYQDAKANVQECSLDDAQLWLREGYFSSQMKFAVAPKDTDVKQKPWMVFSLNDLIARNGKATPFLFSNEFHSETIEEVEEINEMREEMLELANRREKVMEQLQLLQSRHASLQESAQRIAKAFPVLATRCVQTHATMSLAAKVEISETSQPPIVPKPGVDPFAVLKSIPKESTVRKVSGDDILYRFEHLRKQFDRCDKKALVLRTANMVNKRQPVSCRLCDLRMESTSTFIEHVTCKKHAWKLTAVNADSLDFWFDAVAQVSKSEPRISPLAILSACINPANPHPDLQEAAVTMQRKLQQCDKKILDGEPALRALFNTRTSCSVCVRHVVIDKPANLIAHFATPGHIAAVIKCGGMHAEVIDYWMRALDRATVSGIHY